MEEAITATTNNDEIAALTKEAVKEVMPFMNINETYQTMGSEDMSIWLDAVPGCFFFIGSANAEKGLNSPHHHPNFDFDETVLPMGVAAMASAVKHILEVKSS
jgi:amidohydrolase